MKIQELNKMFKTGEQVQVPVNLVGAETQEGKPMLMVIDKYKAGLGDLVEAYVKHLVISRWRRSYDWRMVEERLRSVLNEVEFTWNR